GFMAAGNGAISSASGLEPSAFIGIPELLIGLLVLWASIASGIRRCHDMNQSGVWLFVYYVVPFASLILLLRKGTEGPNRFGSGQAAHVTVYAQSEDTATECPSCGALSIFPSDSIRHRVECGQCGYSVRPAAVLGERNESA
ncbi:MAG TPA: DUF805 domain-containing protein, partial [Blastocatellia bacterium]|nr:DUF805 domain-containing protein [Blastocatellia bacterium]